MRILSIFCLLAALTPYLHAWQLENVPPAGIHVPVWAGSGDSYGAESFSATIDGEPARVLTVSGPQDDLMLLVVLDLTDDLAAVEQARRALIERINELPPNHFVGVMQAQNGLRVLAEPSGDHAAAAAAIRSYPVGGRAGLLNTVEKAASIGSSVMSTSGVRLAILYLTDTDICNYRENFCNDTVNRSDGGDLSRGEARTTIVRDRIARMTAALGGTQAPLFICQLVYKTDQLNVAYQTGLIGLTAATGGSTTIARSVSEIPAGISQLVDRIRNHYSVTVAVPDGARDKVAITLRTQQGSQLTYRSDYVLE
jgi:hypothetical protein